MKKSVLIAGIIISLALIGGGVFWYVKNQNRQPVNNPPITNNRQEQIATSTKENDNSNWQTYRNEEYGFEFKYPSGLTIKNWAYKTPNFELLLYLGNNKNIGDGAISFSVEKNIKNFDVKKIFSPIPQENIKIKETTIGENNYKAYEAEINFYSVDGNSNTINYFIENLNKLLEITYDKDKSYELSENIFKTILSTFKFIK